jgi:hypothetical protein
MTGGIFVARENIVAARKRATKIRGGATMVASCVRGLTVPIFLSTCCDMTHCIVIILKYRNTNIS